MISHDHHLLSPMHITSSHSPQTPTSLRSSTTLSSSSSSALFSSIDSASTLTASTSTSSLGRSKQQLELYKEISEKTLDKCDQSFINTKQSIMQDFDSLINYLNDRRVEMLTQLAVELESHKQELEKNRDKAQHLIESIDRKIRQTASGVGGAGSSSPQLSSMISRSASNTNLKLTGSISKSTGSMLSASTSSGELSELYLKNEQIALLKESIDIIEWSWDGEFQNLIHTNNLNKHTKSVATPSQLEPTTAIDEQDVVEISLADDDSADNCSSSTTSIGSRNRKESFDSGGVNGSRGVGSNVGSGSSNLGEQDEEDSDSVYAIYAKRHMKKEKQSLIFGKLAFHTKTHPQYKELNLHLPKQCSIFSIGGHLNGFDQYSTERYDFAEQQWRSLAPLHQMDNDFTSVYDGRSSIYNFGGSLTPSKITKYSVNDDRWETLETEIPEGGRFLHTAVYDNKQYVYLLGGFPRANVVLRFNLVTQEFTKLASSKNVWKQSAVYDSSSNSIYTIGGCNMSGESLDCVDRYDIDENRWYEMASLHQGMYSGAAVIDSSNGYIYAFGGFSSKKNESLNRVERYSIEYNKWELVEPSMPQPMILNNSAFFDGSANVYIVGGSNPSSKESFSHVYRFNIVTFEWDNPIGDFKHQRYKGSTVFVSK